MSAAVDSQLSAQGPVQTHREPTKRRREKEHKKSKRTRTEEYAYVLFRNLPHRNRRQQWDHAERMQLSISEKHLERELARSREPGKEVTTVMSALPAIQLKHITRLQTEMNKVEKSSRYEWRIASLWQDKPSPEFGNVPQTMWIIMRRERLEKSKRKSERHSPRNKSKALQPDEDTEQPTTPTKRRLSPLRAVPEASPEAAPEADLPLNEFAEEMPNPAYSYAPYGYYPIHYSPEAYMHYHLYPPHPYAVPASQFYFPEIPRRFARSSPSMDSLAVQVDLDHSGYSSDGSEADSVTSNLTSGSSASSGSQSSTATPPHGTPLRGILRRTPRGLDRSDSTNNITSNTSETSSDDVSGQQSSSNESSPNESGEEPQAAEPQATVSSGLRPLPYARCYQATAPHARDDWRWKEKAEGIEQADQESSTSTDSSSTRKTRFSDVANFCYAFEYDTAEESEVETFHYDDRSLVNSKYVQYGCD